MVALLAIASVVPLTVVVIVDMRDMRQAVFGGAIVVLALVAGGLFARSIVLAQDAAFAVQALRSSEERFKRLFDAGIIGIVLTDVEGKVYEANEAFLVMCGFTAEDVASGRVNTLELTPPEWKEAQRAASASFAEAGVASPWEKEYFRKDGSRVPVLVGATMVDGGRVLAFILDLTAQKRAEQAVHALVAERRADAKFRGLLEAGPDAMIIVDTSGNVVILNAQAEKLFGYSRDELLGEPASVLVPERLRKVEPGGRATFFGDATTQPMEARTDLFGRRKDGSEFPIEVTSSPLATEQGVLVSSAIRDITARRQVEGALRAARDDAETASRELEAFSYSVAHDLRAPLRAINGYSAALAEDLGAALDAESAQHLRRIGAAAVRMGHLIDALLGLSRVSRTEIARDRVNLSDVAQAVVEQLRMSDPSRQVDVVIQPGLVSTGDPQLLHALLENLLDNAWKFTSQVDRARIEIGRTFEDGEWVLFVRDNGAGFDMSFVEKLFSPFQRLHALGEFSGVGIGLATVQRIVRRHRGKIWARGQVGAGATFYFTLEARQETRK